MKKAYLVLAGAFILWNCGKTAEPEVHHEHETEVSDSEMHHHEHAEDDHGELAAIELNDGEKWKINEEMVPFLKNGEEIVTEFVQSNSVDYAGLVEQLKEQNEKLVKSCTMEGKSHEELHKWLHPHLDMVKELEKGEGNPAEIVKNIQESYHSFYEYFQ